MLERYSGQFRDGRGHPEPILLFNAQTASTRELRQSKFPLEEFSQRQSDPP
jgi:hypothetical protein